ncbi:MAG: hypothetical protein D6720_03320 [Gammaproteobacteria bacterium]|nr:MAG: hypothetical protein D6720_03320 [Gammaproteobacteria bacterium]
MKDALFWLAVTGGEVLLVVFVLLLIYWVRHSAAARRDRRAVKQLVEKVRQGRAEREASIDCFLAERMGLEGAERDMARVAILREELALLQRFAQVYRDRLANDAGQFHIAVEAATAPYLELRGGGAGAVGEAVDPAELEALRQENQRLSEELTVTMETMSRMLSEYSSMFAGGGVETPAPGDDSGDTTGAPTAAAEARASSNDQAGLPERSPVALDEQALDISEQPAGSAAEPAAEMPAVTEASASASSSADIASVTEAISAPDVSLLAEEGSNVTAEPEAPEGVAGDELAAVAPEAIDDLLAEDPLEADLGGLFDEDEIAALDDEGEKPADKATIAI